MKVTHIFIDSVIMKYERLRLIGFKSSANANLKKFKFTDVIRWIKMCSLNQINKYDKPYSRDYNNILYRCDSF